MLMLIIVKYNVGKILSSRRDPFVECSALGPCFSRQPAHTHQDCVYQPQSFRSNCGVPFSACTGMSHYATPHQCNVEITPSPYPSPLILMVFFFTRTMELNRAYIFLRYNCLLLPLLTLVQVNGMRCGVRLEALCGVALVLAYPFHECYKPTKYDTVVLKCIFVLLLVLWWVARYLIPI